MASSTTHFSNKVSLIIACFGLQFLFSSCSPLERMESHEELENVSELYGLLDEFRVFEEKDDEWKCGVDFNRYYTTLLKGINDFEKKERKSADSIKVLQYLGTALSSRVYNLKYNYESNLIGNITDHLRSVKKDLETLRDSQDTSTYLKVLNKYKEQYKLSIEDKLRESNNLVENFIRPSLEKLEHDLNYELGSLDGQMMELYSGEKDKEILAEKEKMLGKTLLQRELLMSFRLVWNVMSFLSGPGISAVWHIGSGSKFNNSNFHSIGSRNYIEITSEMNILEEKTKHIFQQKIKPFTNAVDGYYNAARFNTQQFSEGLQKVLEIKQKLSNEKLSFKEVRILEDEFLLNINMNILPFKPEYSHKSNQNVESIIPKLKESLALGTYISYIFQNFLDNTSILRLKEYINENERNLVAIKNYEDGIQDMVDTVVSNIKNDISSSNSLERIEYFPSECSPKFALWGVQRFLNETKTSLSEMTYLFEAEGELLNFLEGFKETMTSIVEVYDHIQNYQQQQLLASNIEAIISGYYDSDVGINDTQFPGAIEELDLVIRSNIVLQIYRTAMDAFKQFVFPFASHYLCRLTPLDINDAGATAKAVSQIEIVQSKVKSYERKVKKIADYIAKNRHNMTNNSTGPFFVWKNNDHLSAIRDLLSGKEVLLKADTSGFWMDAIKIEYIGLKFKTRDRDLQSNFTNLLKNFRLRGVHLGNSYYRYLSKVYLIPTKSREFDFPFKIKRKTGDMMMSPYASWRFTLVNMTDEVDFEELAKYADAMDLELVGSGFYAKRKLDKQDVDKYYNAIDENGSICYQIL